MGLFRSLRDFFTPEPAAPAAPADVTLSVPGMY